MNISSRIHVPWEDGKYASSLPLIASLPSNALPYAVMAFLFLAVVLSIHHSTSRGKFDNTDKFPLFNPKSPWEFSSKRTKQEYHMNSTANMLEGVKKFGDNPYRILSFEHPEALVLPARYAEEIKDDARLSFAHVLNMRLHIRLPGFRPWEIIGQRNRIVQHIVRNELTPSLAKITGPLSNECELVMAELLPNDAEWHTITLKKVFVELVARLATVAFLGVDMSRNPEWIDIAINYTIVTVQASARLNECPSFLRRFANMIIPECRHLQAIEKRAQVLVEAELAKRRQCQARGENPEYNDVLQWFDEQYQKLSGVYSPTGAQLVMTVVAIHTTTDLLGEVILDLARHPELIGPLRQEMLEALSGGQGITRSAVHHMKLLDSVIKETQRTKPAQNLFMERRAMEDVTLSGGIQLKKDGLTMVMGKLKDPEVYGENPDEYDGYRFYRMRQQPGKANSSLLVTTTPDYLAFGHGLSACPGRFFAAQEIKIILCQLLLKYEWRLPEGDEAFERVTIGNMPNLNPFAPLVIRKRNESEYENIVW